MNLTTLKTKVRIVVETLLSILLLVLVAKSVLYMDHNMFNYIVTNFSNGIIMLLIWFIGVYAFNRFLGGALRKEILEDNISLGIILSALFIAMALLLRG